MPRAPAFTAERSIAIAHALTALADGRTVREVADALGCDIPTIRQWALSKQATDLHPDIVELFFHARIIEADKALDGARDHAEVAKRTAQCKNARFDAERRVSRLWGAKQEVIVHDDRPPPDLHEVARRVAFINAQAAHLAAGGPRPRQPLTIDARAQPEPACAAPAALPTPTST